MAPAPDDALAERLQPVDFSRYHVVALPDFFLDHFVNLPAFDAAVSALKRVHDQGGGNLHGVPQHFRAGGNAANTAYAAARLGARSHLLARTSPFGATVLERSLGAAGVDLTRVRRDGDIAVTTAMEFGPERTNVMLSTAGSVADFGFDALDENDRTLVAGAHAVVVTNWAQNARGTALVRGVVALAADHDTLAFVDIGDPAPRAAELAEFLQSALTDAPHTVLGLNGNECDRAAAALGVAANGGAVARALRCRVDVHTTSSAATFTADGTCEAEAAAWSVPVARATGAGDVWNAANVLGHVADFAPHDRLRFANAVAAAHVSERTGPPPDRAAVNVVLRGANRT